MAYTKGSAKFNEKTVRNILLENIRIFRVKFKKDYGNMVLCYDGENCWRKSIFSHYKESRKEAKETSKFDWSGFFEIMKNIKKEFSENLPYDSVEIPNMEADDIIASLVMKNYESENIIIISSDKDFLQLQRYPNVKQYSPYHRKELTCEDPQKTLFEHICRGDSSDGIPNILSDDDVLITEGTRQKSITSKKLEEWWKDKKIKTFDKNVPKNFERNKKLIDFKFIPEEVLSQVNPLIGKGTRIKHISDRSMLTYLIEKAPGFALCLSEF